MTDKFKPPSGHHAEVVTRSAPRWAWGVIDAHITKLLNPPSVELIKAASEAMYANSDKETKP